MGLSSLPAPSEGILCVLIVNTALSLSIFKGLVRTILHIVGIHISSTSAPPPPPPSSSPPPPPPSLSSPSSLQSQPSDHELCPSYSYIEEFRSRIPTVRFGDAIAISTAEGEEEHECSVCLSQFEAESEINHLACGHVFHRACLEKWFDYNYWNITCPLCRTLLIPEEDISCFW